MAQGTVYKALTRIWELHKVEIQKLAFLVVYYTFGVLVCKFSLYIGAVLV